MLKKHKEPSSDVKDKKGFPRLREGPLPPKYGENQLSVIMASVTVGS